MLGLLVLSVDPPPINLLITLSEPADSWHLFPRGCPIQIHNHIVLGDQKLQCADDIPATGQEKKIFFNHIINDSDMFAHKAEGNQRNTHLNKLSMMYL